MNTYFTVIETKNKTITTIIVLQLYKYIHMDREAWGLFPTCIPLCNFTNKLNNIINIYTSKVLWWCTCNRADPLLTGRGSSSLSSSALRSKTDWIWALKPFSVAMWWYSAKWKTSLHSSNSDSMCCYSSGVCSAHVPASLDVNTPLLPHRDIIKWQDSKAIPASATSRADKTCHSSFKATAEMLNGRNRPSGIESGGPDRHKGQTSWSISTGRLIQQQRTSPTISLQYKQNQKHKI